MSDKYVRWFKLQSRLANVQPSAIFNEADLDAIAEWLDSGATRLMAVPASATPAQREAATKALTLERECETCAHEVLDGDDYPCSGCMTPVLNMWTPPMQVPERTGEAT